MDELTLIFLTWNRRYLIHSVLYNVWRNNFPFKLVIVDNNSTDGTREYLLEHKDEIDTLILKRKNFGCVVLNEAIRHAASSSKYVALNADDHILHPKWAETMYQAIKAAEQKIKIGYISSILHYAIPKKGSMEYLKTHKIPYEQFFNNPWIRIDPWNGTIERTTCTSSIKFGNMIYTDARAVGGGGTIIPINTFKKLGLFRSYGLRGLYDGEFRSRCAQYGLRVGYLWSTAFVHVKEMFLNPERYADGYRSIRPTAEQQAQLNRDSLENQKSAKKGIPPPSAPQLLRS